MHKVAEIYVRESGSGLRADIPSSSGVPTNFIENSVGDECLLVRKIGE